MHGCGDDAVVMIDVGMDVVMRIAGTMDMKMIVDLVIVLDTVTMLGKLTKPH